MAGQTPDELGRCIEGALLDARPMLIEARDCLDTPGVEDAIVAYAAAVVALYRALGGDDMDVEVAVEGNGMRVVLRPRDRPPPDTLFRLPWWRRLLAWSAG